MELADLTGVVLDGRYRVIEPVAQGAMGVVYRAERVKLGRIVAVKVLHELLPEELSSRRRFEVEAMAMAKLEHPHCAAVVDVGLHEGRPFVVMDFVSGQNLKDLIDAEAPLPIPRAVEILRQILSGLAHAHELGIIHRDIKPANLVLSQKAGLGDHVKILDFGLARVSQDSSLTTGIVVGTPSYMAPEQIRGAAIDGRVDVYACGVVLFELLTGTKPFVSAKDDPIEVCSMHLKQPPPRLADRRPGVDFGELEAVVARALAKSADDRHASAVELAAALDAVVPRRATPVAGVPAVTSTPAAGAPAVTATPAAGVETPPPPVLGTEPTTLASGADVRAAAIRAASAGASPAPAPAPGAPAPAFGPAPAAVVPAPAFGPAPAPAPGVPAPAAGAPAAGPGPRDVRRIAIVVGGALVLLVVIVAIVAGGGSDPAVRAPDAAAVAPAPPAPPAPGPADETIARANELIAGGQKSAALELMLDARKLYRDDARLPYLAGKLYFERLYWTDGMKMFREAIRLDPGYRSDRELIRTVLRGFITTPRTDPALAEFLREDIGAEARPFLEETATGHPNSRIRARAADELRRYP